MSYKEFFLGENRFFKFDKLENLGLFNIFTTSDFDFRFRDEKSGYGTVIQNYLNEIFKLAGISPRAVFTCYQEHTNNVVVIKSLDSGRVSHYSRQLDKSDGMITALKDVVLITKFADCTPVIIYDPVKRVHANVHSGWKGTCKHISLFTVEKMITDFNCSVQDMIACIGPSIGKDDFEIKSDCLDVFKDSFGTELISKMNIIGDDKYTVDLHGLIIDELLRKGFDESRIYEIPFSTRYDERFHSYRRESGNYGLMAMITMQK